MFRAVGDLARNPGPSRDDRARVELVSAVRNASRGLFHFSGDVNRPSPGQPVQKRALGAAAAQLYEQLRGAVGAIDISKDERIALGVVLEPTLEMGAPDSQGDLYSAATVRAAKESWDRNGRVMGLQHQGAAGNRVTVLDSFILDADATVNGAPVVSGSWLLAVHVEDPELWRRFRSGDISGFSIGGYANRVPLDD